MHCKVVKRPVMFLFQTLRECKLKKENSSEIIFEVAQEVGTREVYGLNNAQLCIH